MNCASTVLRFPCKEAGDGLSYLGEAKMANLSRVSIHIVYNEIKTLCLSGCRNEEISKLRDMCFF
jgi:hypothetical protein